MKRDAKNGMDSGSRSSFPPARRFETEEPGSLSLQVNGASWPSKRLLSSRRHADRPAAETEREERKQT